MTSISEKNRFRILVCIDGSQQSKQALKYAVRLGKGNDADITLLYVRPVDQELSTGGIQVSVVRENMLNWGLELPGMKALQNARQTLIDLGFMEENWDQEFRHVDVRGTALGDNMVIYRSESGRTVMLKLMVSPSVLRGILDECEIGEYNITILGGSRKNEAGGAGRIDPSVAQAVASEHHGTVIVARNLEEGQGHLVCVRNSEASFQAARADARIASRCNCPVHLFSVALDDSRVENAQKAIDRARTAIEKEGYKIASERVAIGDPVEQIVERGQNYSLIVLATAERTGWRRFFVASVAYKVLRSAKNSVMIAR